MKKIVTLCVTLLLVCSLFGGGKKDTNPEGTIKLRLGYMPNLVSASMVAIGIQEGIFTAEGIDVEPVRFASGPPAIAAMTSGNLDSVIIGHGAHALAIEGEAELFYLDCLGNSDKLLTTKAKGIIKITDLRGKTIACTKGTSGEALLNIVLEKAGLKPSDVTVINMDNAGAATALITGQVDAVSIWPPTTTTVYEQLGDKVVLLAEIGDYADIAPSPGSWIVKEKFMQNNPEVLLRLTRAFLRINDFRAANIDKTAQYVSKLIDSSYENIIKEKETGRWLTADEIYSWAKDGTIAKIYTVEQELFIASGRITKRVGIETYFTPKFIIEAYESLKK